MPHRYPQLSDLARMEPREPSPAPGDVAAAVALVMSGDATDPQLCLIERAPRVGDPWSGHMALPGGRHSGSDANLRVTAEREAREEVSLELTGAAYLGHVLDHSVIRGGRRALTLSAFAFHIDQPVTLHPSDEVARAFWIPLRELWSPAQQTEIEVHGAGQRQRHSATRVHNRHVWGLTRRVLAHLGAHADVPLPEPARSGTAVEIVTLEPSAQRDFDAWTLAR